MEFELNEIPQHLRKYFTPKHERWIVRNDIIWAKRNGMPESVTDRFSKKHEYFFFMVKSEKYFFDLDAIRDKTITGIDRCDVVKSKTSSNATALNSGRAKELDSNGSYEFKNNPNGKNPGSVSDFLGYTNETK